MKKMKMAIQMMMKMTMTKKATKQEVNNQCFIGNYNEV